MTATLQKTGLWRTAFAKNVSWTFSGYVIPLAAALALIPVTLQNAGKENYGLFALATVLVGFSGVFDLGLGRSLTFNLIRARTDSEPERFRAVYATGLVLLTTLGLLAAVIIFGLSSWLSSLLSTGSTVSRREIGCVIKMVGLAVPFVLIQMAGMSVLEAAARFKQVAILKSVTSTLIFAAPFLISLTSSSAVSLVFSLLLVRVLGASLSAAAALREIRALAGKSANTSMLPLVKLGTARQLLAYGSWVALSNVIGAVLTRGDVILISVMMGTTAVATYSAAVEVISKLGIVGSSIGLVLFSKITNEIYVRPAIAYKYFRIAVALTGAVLAPVCIGIAVFSEAIMSTWLRDSYSADVAFVAAAFALGYLVHGIGQPAYLWLQAQGKPKVPATIHIVELLIFLSVMPWLIAQFGLRGAAIGWVGRVTLSVIALHVIRIILNRKRFNEI